MVLSCSRIHVRPTNRLDTATHGRPVNFSVVFVDIEVGRYERIDS